MEVIGESGVNRRQSGVKNRMKCMPKIGNFHPVGTIVFFLLYSEIFWKNPLWLPNLPVSTYGVF